MKPSEYVKRYLHYPILNQKDFLKLIKSYDNNLDNIDKMFINKEEFKEKINKLLSKEFIDSLYNDSRQEVTFRVIEKKKEILKLLECENK